MAELYIRTERERLQLLVEHESRKYELLQRVIGPEYADF